MITQERVMSISGSRVQTDQGLRRCAGNAPVAVGDMVTVIGGLIVGWNRRTAARPVALMPQYYRFADAAELKMHRLNLDFVEMDTEDIARPAEDTGSEAVLVLHCYNESVEYLVWFIGFRCLIQRDGATAAVFTSEISQVLYADAYINEDGEIVFAVVDGSAKKIVSYINGTLGESFTYSTDDLETALEAYAGSLMSTAAASTVATVSDESTTVDNYLLLGPRNAYFGTISERHYTGLDNTVDSVSASTSGAIYDLWGRAIIADVRATVYAHIGARFQVLSRNQVTGDVVDTSNTAPLAEPYIDVNRYYKQAAGGTTVLCDYAAIDSPAGSMSAVTEQTVISSKNSDVTVSGYVHAVENAGAFTGSLTLPGGIDGWYAGAGIYGCTITFTSGANAGQSRTINNYGNMTSVTPITVSAPFNNVVSVSDTFTIEMALIDVEATATEATISVAVPFDNVSQTTCTEAAEIDIGNGYKLRHKIANMDPEGQSIHLETSIKYGDETAYTSDNPYEYLTDGAWLTEPEKLAGVLPGGALAIDAAEAVATTKTIDTLNFVTKRFAGGAP